MNYWDRKQAANKMNENPLNELCTQENLSDRICNACIRWGVIFGIVGMPILLIFDIYILPVNFFSYPSTSTLKVPADFLLRPALFVS